VLVLLLSTATAGALGPVPGPTPRASPSEIAKAQGFSASPARPLGIPRPDLVAAILGDRQRMVQVALIFMGIAILILTRGNRF